MPRLRLSYAGYEEARRSFGAAGFCALMRLSVVDLFVGNKPIVVVIAGACDEECGHRIG